MRRSRTCRSATTSFAPFLADVERTRTGKLLSREDLEGTALGLKVDSLLVRHDGRWVALLPLIGVADPAALRAALGTRCCSTSKAQADELVAGYRAQSLRSTLIGLACIVVVVYVGVRSIPATLRLLAPVLGAVLLTAAALLAVGEKLTIFHLVSLLARRRRGPQLRAVLRPQPRFRGRARPDAAVGVASRASRRCAPPARLR